MRGLIGSLLHLDQSEIKSTVVTNPIRLGEQIDNKTFILDINVLMNDDTNLNLEMQVINMSNWTDRSLSYLCRAYDNLYHGEDYSEVNRAIHIGILDFTLFGDFPEFYASYKLMNVKTHHVFSDKLLLNVLDLNHPELATDEDRRYEIDQWARMFKAKTWEELRMIAEKNKYMSEAAAEMYERNAEEIVKQQCLARDEYYRQQKWIQAQMEKKDQALAEKDQALAEKDQALAEKDQTIAEKEQEIAKLKALLRNQ